MLSLEIAWKCGLILADKRVAAPSRRYNLSHRPPPGPHFRKYRSTAELRQLISLRRVRGQSAIRMHGTIDV